MRGNLAVQYAGAALAWGASFLFIKVGLEGLSFTQVVLWRLVFGAVTLGAVLGLTRTRLPREAATWAHLSVLAVAQCVVPWLLFSWAEQSISSGLASIYNATTPLMTMSVALAFLPGEKLTDAKLFGLLLGFTGVVVVLAPWQAGIIGSVPAQLACLGATASYGVALVYLRRFILPRGVGTPTIAFMQVSIAAAAMVLAAPWVASTQMHLTPAIVASMIGLGRSEPGWRSCGTRTWCAAGAHRGLHRHLPDTGGRRRARCGRTRRAHLLEPARRGTRGDRGNRRHPTVFAHGSRDGRRGRAVIMVVP